MPVYNYKAFTTAGQLKTGIADADNPREARLKLRRDGLLVTDISEVESLTEKKTSAWALRRQRKATSRELPQVTRQLASTLDIRDILFWKRCDVRLVTLYRTALNCRRSLANRTATGAFNERTGVCRDYAHLAIAFCRCMNIPARYCTGYLSDVGTPPPYAVGDFAAWFEAWIGGRWQMFDPRNNVPRIGRILMARGRDASDVAIATTFGPNTLVRFRVWTDEIPVNAAVAAVAGTER